MRKSKKVTVEVEKTVFEECTCDLCGVVAKHGNWESSVYEIAETEIEIEIRYKDGDEYPSGGSGTKYNVDICPDCFKTKLIPWLESQGATCKSEEWDWSN